MYGGLILRLIFSRDGSIIQVNDSSFSLSYFNVDTGLQIVDTKHLRDIEWAEWNSICGWPVQVTKYCFLDILRVKFIDLFV